MRLYEKKKNLTEAQNAYLIINFDEPKLLQILLA